MRKYIFIGAGGILGSILRYIIRSISISHYSGDIPLNTLIINVTGSFILALILTVAYEIAEFDVDVRLGIAVGFIGAYTTFSTLCKEFMVLFFKGSYFPAISYGIISVILGILSVYCGVIFARKVMAKLVGKREESVNESGAK